MLKVLFSMNTHQVATPDLSLEDARSYVIFCREGGEKISAYIGLHLLATNRRFFYPHSSNPFPESYLNGVDEEARIFAEGLGAVLDEIDITKMSSEERDHWIDDQAIFNLKKQIEPKPAETAAAPTDQVRSDIQPQGVDAQAAPASGALVPPVQVQPQQPPAQPQQPLVQPQQPLVQLQQPLEQPVPPMKPASASLQAAQQVSATQSEDIVQQAIRAGVVKEPRTQLKKEIQSASGILSRDKEALARLLSSF